MCWCALRNYSVYEIFNKSGPKYLGRAALQRPHWLQWDAPHLPPNLSLPLRWSPSPCNTSIPQPTPLTTLNGIQIHSAFCHNTLSGQTDQLTVVTTESLIHKRLQLFLTQASAAVPCRNKWVALISVRSGHAVSQLLCCSGTPGPPTSGATASMLSRGQRVH